MTHEVFFTQSNSLLVIILQLPIPKTRLNSIPLVPSSHPGRMASRNSTLTALPQLNFSFKPLCRTTQKAQRFYCWEGVFTVPLHSNGSYSIVACEFVAAEMFSLSRWLAINVYSDLSIRDFGHLIAIWLICSEEGKWVWQRECSSLYPNWRIFFLSGVSPLGTAATTGLLYQPQIMVTVEQLVEWNVAGETEVLGEILL
jgi:hypothetical protein